MSGFSRSGVRLMRFAATKRNGTRGEFFTAVFVGLFALGLFLAGSSQSLWLDELGTWQLSQAGTFPDWLDRFANLPNSDGQIFLYHLIVWAATQAFGDSEVVLRGVNLFPFAIGIVALVLSASRTARLHVITTSILLVANGFAAAYLVEARPYALLYGGACLLIAGLLDLSMSPPSSRQSHSGSVLFLIGGSVMAGASVLAFPWILSGFWYVAWKSKLSVFWSRTYLRVASVLTFAWLMLLLGIYFHSFLLGARASQAFGASPATFAFAAWELSGLAGLGPGRLDARANGVSSAIPYAAPMIAGVAAFAFSGMHFLKRCCREIGYPQSGYLVTMIGLPLAGIVALALSTELRLLGRHLTPLVPLVMFAIAVGVDEQVKSSALAEKIAGFASLALILVSGVLMVSADRHSRDDFRAATLLATAVGNKDIRVQWIGPDLGFEYYSRPPQTPKSGRNIDFLRRTKPLRTEPPGLILLNRPEEFDSEGLLPKELSRGTYLKCPAPHGFSAYVLAHSDLSCRDLELRRLLAQKDARQPAE